MKFTDHFLKEDKNKALLYRKDIEEYKRISSDLINAGKFDKAKMFINHYMVLIDELKWMQSNKLHVDRARNDLRQITGEEIKMIRDKYHA